MSANCDKLHEANHRIAEPGRRFTEQGAPGCQNGCTRASPAVCRTGNPPNSISTYSLLRAIVIMTGEVLHGYCILCTNRHAGQPNSDTAGEGWTNHLKTLGADHARSTTALRQLRRYRLSRCKVLVETQRWLHVGRLRGVRRSALTKLRDDTRVKHRSRRTCVTVTNSVVA